MVIQNSSFKSRILAPFLASIGLVGCAALPPVMEHAAPAPVASYETAQSFAASTTAWPGDRWWVGYGDAQLTALIEEALRGTPDLRAAQARILRAEALAKQTGAALLPSIDGNASVDASRQSYNLGFPAPRGLNDNGRATLDFSWELDFWGKNRAALAAATSEAEAARVEAASARLSLSTSIASAYADLASLYADRATAIDARKVRDQSLTLIADRQRNGLENQGAVERARSAKATAEMEIAAIDESIALNRNRIAALLGAGPDRGLAITPPTRRFTAPPGLPTNLAADLLGRRPEVIAARLRTEAAASRIKVAKAGFYPSINLTAFIGLQSLTLGQFAKSDSLVGSAGPAISLPIFNGGRLRGRYREAEAEYDLAVAEYDGAVTQALRDVADAASSAKALALRLDRARAAQTSASAAWQVATNRYRGGLATYLDVLTAEDSLIATRRDVASLESRGFVLDVALVRSLGGGFRYQEGRSS